MIAGGGGKGGKKLTVCSHAELWRRPRLLIGWWDGVQEQRPGSSWQPDHAGLLLHEGPLLEACKILNIQ